MQTLRHAAEVERRASTDGSIRPPDDAMGEEAAEQRAERHELYAAHHERPWQTGSRPWGTKSASSVCCTL